MGTAQGIEPIIYNYKKIYGAPSARAEGLWVSSARRGRGAMAAQRENVNLLFKLYCLAVMTLVAAAYTVALRYTRTSDKELYFSTTAVCITERNW